MCLVSMEFYNSKLAVLESMPQVTAGWSVTTESISIAIELPFPADQHLL